MLHNQEKSLKEIPSLCRGKEAKGGGLGVKTCSCSPHFYDTFQNMHQFECTPGYAKCLSDTGAGGAVLLQRRCVLSDLSNGYAVWGYLRQKGKLKVKEEKHLFGNQRTVQSLTTSITSASLRCSRCSCPTYQLTNKGCPLKMDNVWTLPSVLHDLY